MKKFDKDAMMKQKFWILLGVFALLWLVCLSFVVVNAGGPIDEAKKNYDAAKLAIGKNTHPKNDSFLPPWENYGKTFTKHKNTVWKVAWEGDKPNETLPTGQHPWPGQGGMYVWPEDQGHPLNSRLLYPDSPFEVPLRDWYKTKDAYGKQFADLRTELQPDGGAPAKGQPPAPPLGAVAFKGSYDSAGYYAVMNPIDFEDSAHTRTPDSEECWLAQEDFWVKRELLYVVRDAMRMAAHLDPVADAKAKEDAPAKDAKDAKVLGRQVFRNASWEVTLVFDKDDKGQLRISPDSRIKNVHVSHREQTLGNPSVPIDGAFFWIHQGESPGRTFHFEGEKVPWDKERPLGVDNGYQLSAIDPMKPVELEQVFDRGDTPIASIEEIRIPYVSNRNAHRPLVAAPPKRFGKTEAVADKTKTADASSSSLPMGVAPPISSGGPSMMQMGGMGAMGGQGGASSTGAAQSTPDRTSNIGLDRARYLFVTDQSRHLPLAMTLTVDQSHLHEILVAVANSRLRFQTTQVEFRRQPAGGGASTGPGSNMSPSTGLTPSSMPAEGPMPTPSFRPPAFGGGAPGATAATMTTPAFDNPNLVEVTIYGIASLYERPREEKK